MKEILMSIHNEWADLIFSYKKILQVHLDGVCLIIIHIKILAVETGFVIMGLWICLEILKWLL